jgi:zinc transport system substrate-binding protein
MVLILKQSLTLLVLTAVLAACGGSASNAGDGRTKVVAAFYPLAEVAREVGGTDVHVDDLTPPGAEPHDLEITTKQVDKIESADAVFVMGHKFQPAVEDASKQRNKHTVRILDQIAATKQRPDDPHVWLDPVYMKRIAAIVERELAKVDPAHATTYAANAGRYTTQLDALGREYAAGFADCERKEIVTSHEAFGWLAQRYGLTQHAIAGIDPEQEPSANRIAQLSDLAKRDGVTTIFTETLVSPRVADTLAREAGGLKTEVLNPLEGLTDSERKHGDDYGSVMRDNLKTLRTALGCR